MQQPTPIFSAPVNPTKVSFTGTGTAAALLVSVGMGGNGGRFVVVMHATGGACRVRFGSSSAMAVATASNSWPIAAGETIAFQCGAPTKYFSVVGEGSDTGTLTYNINGDT